MSFKKETEKIVLLQMKGLIQIIVKFRTEKNECIHFYNPPEILLKGPQYIFIGHKVLCSNTLKKNELEVYISPKGNKLACFTNNSSSFQLHDLVNDF